MALLQSKSMHMALGTGRSAKPAAFSTARAKRSGVCRASKAQSVGQQAVAAAAAAMLTMGSFAGGALASEFDILGEPTPTTNYFIDDANALSKSTRSEITKKLKTLEINTGYRLEVVTVRKLEFETDAFAFADKALEGWYSTPEEASKKGILLVVTAGKEGAVTGGQAFVEAVGEDLVDSIVGENIPIFTEEEKYNQTVVSCIDRIQAKLEGNPVPEAPKREDGERKRNYKTKEETDKTKSVTATVVGTLLVIAVVVPMLQYYGYTARD